MKQRGMFVWGRRVKRFCRLQRALSCRRTPFPSRGTWQSETASSLLMQGGGEPFEYTLHAWLQLRFLPVYKRLLKEKQRGLLKKVMN